MKNINSFFYNKINIIELVILILMMTIPSAYYEGGTAEGSFVRLLSTVLFCLPVAFLLLTIKNRVCFALVSGIIMFTTFIEAMMVLLYNNYIISGNIHAMLTTTKEEGGSFVLSTLNEVPFALPVVLLWFFAILLYKKKSSIKQCVICAATFFSLTVLYLAFQLQVKWQGNITTKFYVEQNVLGRPPYNFWFQCYSAYNQMKQREYIKEAENMNFGAKRSKHDGKEVFVLAIGESLRYDNLSLAGYKRSTTPLLESLDNVTLFSNYYSTANLTMYSVPQIITRATPEDFVLNYKEKSVFMPFKECGFKTFIISVGNLLTYETYLSQGCDSLIRLPELKDELVAHKVDSILSLYDKTFFIIQFFGNHGPYRNFPSELDKYHPNPVSDNVGYDNHEANVNAYDNTVLFTDYNVYNIIKSIDKPNTQSTFIMVSDHGADYDTGVSDHGGNCNPRKAEYHVPLIFWHSTSWGECHKLKLSALESNKDKPVNADNIFYTVCDMADIAISRQYAKPEWSLFNPKLQLHERRLLVPDGKNTIKVE